MKKILTLLLAFVVVLSLSACKPDDTPPVVTENLDLQAVEAAITAADLGDLTEVLAGFALPATHADGATYSWFSSDTNIISISGSTTVVTRPTAGENDATVTLTVTATKGIETAQKTFTATVIAVPGGVAEKLAEAKKSLRIEDIFDLGAVVETNLVLPTVSPLYPEITITWEVIAYADMTAELPTEPTKPAGYLSEDDDGRDAWWATSVYAGCELDVTTDLTGNVDDGVEPNILSTLFVSYLDASNPFTDGTAYTTGIPEEFCGWGAYANGVGGQALFVAHGVWDAAPTYDDALKTAVEAYDQYEEDFAYYGAYDEAIVATTANVGTVSVVITRPAATTNVRLVATLSWNDVDVTQDDLEKDFELVVVAAPTTDAAKLAEAKIAFKVFGIDFVDDNFTLPTTGLYGATVVWESQNELIMIVDAAGNVTVASPLQNVAVTLTATITVGTESTTKSFVAVAVGTDSTYTYRTSISDTTNINPHNETLANASTLYGYITAGLYDGQFDWAASIASGAASAEGDYTNSQSLAYDRFPYMAAGEPIDISDDSDMTVWEVSIRNDLKWEDGTAITADDYLYAYKMLLDPRLINERAGGFYTDLKIEGASEYAKQSTAGIDVNDDYTILFDTVGLSKDGDYKLVFNLTTPTTAWDLKGNLMSGISGPVKESLYEGGMNETRTVTNYGADMDKIMSYGPYVMTTWEPGVVYIFEKNDDFFDQEAFRIGYVRYDVIEDQSVSVNEFKAGRLDVAGVGGVYYPEFKNNPNVLLSPVTTTFRWATNVGDRADGETNPMMKYVEFRQALYHAVDRQEMVATVNAPALAQQAFLSPEYIISDTSTQSYRGSAQGQSVLADLYPETAGYNPAAAKTLFDAAYAKAVLDGVINDGDEVWVELAMKDAETNWTTNNWVKDVVTNAFDAQTGGSNDGKFVFNIAAYSTDALDIAEANADFDIMFYGWTGLKFDPISLMGYVWNENFDYMNEKGWTPGAYELEVELPNYAATLTDVTLVDPTLVTEPTEVTKPTGWVATDDDGRTAWYDALDAAGKTAATDYDAYVIADGLYNDYVTAQALYDFDLDVKTDGKATLTFHEWFEAVNPGGFLYGEYAGINNDYLNICAVMEGKLVEEVIGIPLFTSVNTAVYSDRVVHEVQAYHAWMGWGDIRHMYLNAPDPVQ